MSDLENTVVRESIKRIEHHFVLDYELPFLFSGRSPESLSNSEIFRCLYQLEWKAEFDADDELEFVLGKLSSGEEIASLQEEGLWIYSEKDDFGESFVRISKLHDWAVNCFVLVKDRLSRTAIFNSFTDAGFIKVTG